MQSACAPGSCGRKAKQHRRYFKIAGYITFWSKEHIRKLEKARDTGPLSVIYGSHHTKMPSIAAVRAGDVIYPAALLQGTLCVMARLQVERVEPALDYLMREVGFPGGALIPAGTALERVLSCKPEAFAFQAVRNTPAAFFQLSDGSRIESGQPLPEGLKTVYRHSQYQEKPHQCHQEPQTYCAALAASGRGSAIRPRPLPVECLAELRFGPSKGREKPLRLDKNGVPTPVSLSGFVRRMSADTKARFDALFVQEQND